MNRQTLVVFPLLVLFLTSIVGAPIVLGIDPPFSGGETGTLEIVRPVSDNQENSMKVCLIAIQDNYGGQFPLSGGVRDEAIGKIKDNLNDVFYEHEGHLQMSSSLLMLAEDVYPTEPSGDNVYDIIKIDPEFAGELEEMRGWGLGIDKVLLFVGILIGIVVLALIIGVRIFGIGIAGVSIKIVIVFIAFFLLWIILSVLSMPILLDLPYIGEMMWVSLTIIYVIGLLLGLEGGGGED